MNNDNNLLEVETEQKNPKVELKKHIMDAIVVEEIGKHI